MCRAGQLVTVKVISPLLLLSVIMIILLRQAPAARQLMGATALFMRLIHHLPPEQMAQRKFAQDWKRGKIIPAQDAHMIHLMIALFQDPTVLFRLGSSSFPVMGSFLNFPKWEIRLDIPRKWNTPGSIQQG